MVVIEREMPAKRVWLSLDAEYIDKNRQKAIEHYKELSGSEDNNVLEFAEVKGTINEMVLEDDELNIDITTPVGFISVTVPVTESMDLAFVERVVKRINRIKTALESLKNA